MGYRDPDALRAYRKQYYAEHAEEIRAKSRRWYSENRLRAQARTDRWQKDNPGRVREIKRSHRERLLAGNPDARREEHLWQRFGLSRDAVDAIVDAQEGKCPICLGDITWYDAVDHCHKTGKVRGILHRVCNSGLGLLKDDPDLVARALQYLEAHL